MPAPNIAGKRILVVDDEPFVCDAVKMMLAFDGHQVETANSGPEALGIFEKGKFDLVITDFLMPGIDGLELARLIKASTPRRPVLLITAHAESVSQREKARLEQVDAMLAKPFSPRARTIRSILPC